MAKNPEALAFGHIHPGVSIYVSEEGTSGTNLRTVNLRLIFPPSWMTRFNCDYKNTV